MMEPWRRWQQMARESQEVALLAEQDGHFRSSASRYYYAAYQSATAALLYRSVTPPDTREAWRHEATPQLLKEHLEPLIASRDKRKDLAARLGRLYKLRIIADYISGETVSREQIRQAGKDARYLIKVFASVTQGE